MTQLRQVLRKNVRFFILAYSLWIRSNLFIDISVTIIISIYQLVILFLANLTILKMLGVSEDWCKSGKKIITLNDFPATSSDLDVTLLDMKLSQVKQFFEEKARLLVKKRSKLLYLLLIFSLINIFYLSGFCWESFSLRISEMRLLYCCYCLP